MDAACFEIAGQAHSRLRKLLRVNRFLTTAVMVRLYKSQVLSFVEYATPAIYHAPGYFLGQVNNVQTTFLEEMGLSSECALLDFKLAPLTTRRDIAMMGLLQRVARGVAPPQLSSVICRENTATFPRCLRGPSLRHNSQLQDPIDGTHSNMMERSVLGLVYPYNCLPQKVIVSKSISIFQRTLQAAVKRVARDRVNNWQYLIRAAIKEMSITSFQNMFA